MIVLVVPGLSVLPKHFRHSIAGLLALACATSLFARGQFSDFLGYTQVDSSQDSWPHPDHPSRCSLSHDSVASQRRGYFFDRLVVHFDDGTFQELIVSDRILPGTRNYAINLLGERSLESVELWYYKESSDHNPRVSLYGVCSPEGDSQIVAQER